MFTVDIVPKAYKIEIRSFVPCKENLIEIVYLANYQIKSCPKAFDWFYYEEFYYTVGFA